MAKADTVYSLFGLKSPYDVAREEMIASQRLLQSQTDPYAKLGTALGMGLGRMFGGVSPEMERAQQTEQAVKDVEAQIREARAQQAERMKTAEGIEPGPEPKPKSAAEQLLARSQEKSDKFRKIADLLESRGQTSQAARFSDLADKELGKSLTIQKQLADIAAKNQMKWSSIKTRYRLPNGSIVQGGLINGQPAIYLGPGRWAPLPAGAEAIPDSAQPKFAGKVTQDQAVVFLKQTEGGADLSVGDRGALATWIANRATKIAEDPAINVADANEATALAYEEAKQKGIIKVTPGMLYGVNAEINIPGTKTQQTETSDDTADTLGTNEKRMRHRTDPNKPVAILNATTGEFIRWESK